VPGAILHVGAVGSCLHGGVVSVTAVSRVFVSGQPVGTVADNYPIAGCLFQVPVPGGTKPQPCLRVQWTVPATRVLAMGKPVVTQASTGICLPAEQIPQGAPAMTTVQPRVTAL
jgi:hypothetical protein